MKRTLLLLALLTLPLYGQAWSYRGIPYPTDNVPGAMMPTLPTGADTAGWPYDPCTVPTPTFTGAANQYYVNTVTGNNGTAGNGGRGTVQLPRLGLPGTFVDSGGQVTWTIPEGMQIFITGDSTLWGAQTDRIVSVQGTAVNPCWIVGVGPGQPNFGGDKMFFNGQHMLIHNVRFVPSDGACRVKVGGGTGNTGGFKYFMLRYSTATGVGTAGSGENAAFGGQSSSAADPSAYVVFYRNTISNFGKWDRPDANGVDRHGIQPLYYSKYWWIIENTIFHMEGDSVQVCTSGTDNGNYPYRPHYIYIAGNSFYENYENGVDCKNCYHVIISQNSMRYHRNPYVSPNKVAMLLSNDGEGWLSDFQWGIFNDIDDSGTGVKIAGNQASELNGAVPPAQVRGGRSYCIGNRITNCASGVYIDANSTSPDGTSPPALTWTAGAYVVDNTIQVTTGSGINQNRVSQGAGMFATYEISGNLIYRDTAGADIVMSNTGSAINTINVLRNLSYSPAGAVPFVNTGSNTYDSKVGNLESTNPLLVNPPTDLHLGSGSPAIGTNAESPVYQLFQDMYGIDIRRSYDGSQRPRDVTWDIGAYEFGDAPPAVGTATAESVGTTTLSVGP